MFYHNNSVSKALIDLFPSVNFDRPKLRACLCKFYINSFYFTPIGILIFLMQQFGALWMRDEDFLKNMQQTGDWIRSLLKLGTLNPLMILCPKR